jgi:hypothetical protein
MNTYIKKLDAYYEAQRKKETTKKVCYIITALELTFTFLILAL